jgi:hypothetical protein
MAVGTRTYKLSWKKPSGRRGSMTAVLSDTEEREITRQLHVLIVGDRLVDATIEPTTAPSDFQRVMATMAALHTDSR